MFFLWHTDAAVNSGATIKAPVKRTISTGDATKTQILQVTANPTSTASAANPEKRIKLEAAPAQPVAEAMAAPDAQSQ